MALKQIPQETFHSERKKLHCYNESVSSKNLIQLVFYIFYHAGGLTKYLPRPEVKRRNEEPSLSDALTIKKRINHFTGKMRTYLWACLLTTTATPNPIFSPPGFLNKNAWIQQNGVNSSDKYCSLSPHLDAFL